MNTQDHDLSSAFHPTFTGGRQEKQWILQSLRGFYVDEWFTDVLFRVKGGKEATVYCCRAHPATGLDLIAAKIYRPRMFRAMKNDSLYKIGRLIRSSEGKYPDDRTARALKKRSRYGRALDAGAWCMHEVEMLETMWDAGVQVPRVIENTHNAILMEFVGDEYQAAPILQSVSLERDEAEALWERLVHYVRAMLGAYVVHADLSPYNLLYWDEELHVIDLPQAVDAIRHPQAYELFARDVDRIAAYFVRQGLEIDAQGLAFDLWQEAYG
ncbi:MAG: RIO1 family regulatory kinase/ATPase [Planctomycetota bacterium]|nr:RIO1 family regulatory kinase/ATPase [Planctomycetota bacterium]